MTELRKVALVADNDESVAEVLRVFLTREGLSVEVVGDGLRARERLLAGPVDVFVCDLDMPLLAGELLLESLGAQAPPTVIASGYVELGTESRLRRHPAVRDVVRKPFDLLRFAARVAAIARGESQAAEG